MDEVRRKILNEFQGGFPISRRPFRDAAHSIGLEEVQVIDEIDAMIADGTLTRFGPLYHAEHLGGILSLVAMIVPVKRFEEVACIVNAFDEVAHNYERDHRFNMWFVIATDQPSRKYEVLSAIEKSTGLKVYDFPKEAEYFVGLHFKV